MFSNLSPSQEPVAWGAVATAILGLVVAFLPRFGVTLSKDEYTAIAAVVAVLVPIAIGYLVRANVTPTAPLPVSVPAPSGVPKA